MGEYGLFQGQRIKLGTDTDLHSLRFEDRLRVRALPGNLDPDRDAHNCQFRPPFPEEDHQSPGNYSGKGHQLLYLYDTKGYYHYYSPNSLEPPGRVQAHTEHGLLLNITCHHGTKLPSSTEDIRIAWNGRSPHLALESLRCRRHPTKHGALTLTPVITCLACHETWYMTWDELLPYVHGLLKERLTCYAQWDGYGAGSVFAPPAMETA